jgi:glycosyltransferase involved in cell wall biosynthesis
VNVLLTTISLDGERGGGTAQRTYFLARHLRALGVHVEVLAIEGGSLCQELGSAGIPAHVTGSIRLRFQIPLLNLLRLRRLVRSADVVHVLGYWNVLSVAVCALARASQIPYALSAAGEFAALDRPRLDQIAFHAVFGRRMIAGAASLIAITERERQEVAERFDVSSSRVVVMPNGVCEPIAPAVEDDRLPTRRFVLFLGRLAYVKGPDLLLEAFGQIASRAPDANLVFAGPDFGMRTALVERAHELGLADRVSFLGYADDHLRRNAYLRAEFVVVPSRSEAMSLVALEAGAAGKPVLLTDQCGFDEVGGFGGHVVPASIEGLARGLGELLDPSADLARMGQELREFVLEQYAWPKIGQRLLAHLDALYDRRGALTGL